MIASARNAGALLACVFAATALGCAGATGVPQGKPFEPEARRAAYMPDDTDRAAGAVAAAAMGSDPAAARAALAGFETTERLRRAADEPSSGLAPYAQHLVDATSGDAIAYRRATAELLDRGEIDPALRTQLEMEVADDPLLLAKQRIGEGRRVRVTRAVNALSEAVGRSILTLAFAPIRVGQALVGLAVAEHMDDPISLQQRQALAHWKQYVETHPETPEARELVEKIESLNAKWFATKRRRSVRAAEQALEHGQNDLALLLAERALRYAPDDRRARRLRDTAEERVAHRRAERAKSLEATRGPLPDLRDPHARGLLIALMADGGDVVAASDALLATSPEGPLAGAARFARANAAGEAGRESEMWNELAALAGRDPDEEPMARHARALVDTPTQNPWQAFQAAQGSETRQTAAVLALGPLARGPRDRDLPRSVEWLLEAPTLVPVLGGIPWRLVQTAIAPPESKGPGLAAELYLERYPDGEHARELRDWLIESEADGERWIRAHAIAAEAGDTDPERLAELAEQAAKQSIEIAEKQKRRDVRLTILHGASTRYPDTESGARAAELVREEIENASEQRIRISRGFLDENPRIAGPQGLGLRPELLDGDRRNGELHPDGVTLRGGRTLQVALLPASGKKTDDPEKVEQTISAERLSRLVSLLEETSLRNALIDPLAEQEADARRDYYFERARLGVADAPDVRPTAESSFTFVGVRERYNVVRSRESILPIELVISGSLPDLGLGAFPRLRMPRETPDAVLYR
ncbi:MAG: hypothetical protein DCC71_02065 [Proteobacteria bacterium]|nr:MAG: hypothetical protein DCC71_02065 [Pseudomonadota bacterium]